MANQAQKEAAKYDPHITPSDVASREEREGGNFKETPEAQADANTTKGYTVDREGRSDILPVETEPYVNEPGDLREKNEALKAERAKEVAEVNKTDEEGALSMSQDDRGKGTGVI